MNFIRLCFILSTSTASVILNNLDPERLNGKFEYMFFPGEELHNLVCIGNSVIATWKQTSSMNIKFIHEQDIEYVLLTENSDGNFLICQAETKTRRPYTRNTRKIGIVNDPNKIIVYFRMIKMYRNLDLCYKGFVGIFAFDDDLQTLLEIGPDNTLYIEENHNVTLSCRTSCKDVDTRLQAALSNAQNNQNDLEFTFKPQDDGKVVTCVQEIHYPHGTRTLEVTLKSRRSFNPQPRRTPSQPMTPAQPTTTAQPMTTTQSATPTQPPTPAQSMTPAQNPCIIQFKFPFLTQPQTQTLQAKAERKIGHVEVGLAQEGTRTIIYNIDQETAKKSCLL